MFSESEGALSFCRNPQPHRYNESKKNTLFQTHFELQKLVLIKWDFAELNNNLKRDFHRNATTAYCARTHAKIISSG